MSWLESIIEFLNSNAIATGDIDAVMEATGQSERTARTKTKAVRDQRNADRDAEILRLHSEGRKPSDIEHHLKQAGYTKGVSVRSIQRFIAKRQNGNAL